MEPRGPLNTPEGNTGARWASSRNPSSGVGEALPIERARPRRARTLCRGPKKGPGTMFVDTMREAVEGARTLARLDELSRAIWQGHSAHGLTDEEAQRLAELLHARRAVVRGEAPKVGLPPGRPSIFRPRRYQRSPDRSASIARRRGIAAAGPMPPALAARFTTGQLAALAIVAEEVAANGSCALCIDAIAARAGICRRLAQTALRLAEGDGLLTIQERRREGAPSLPNLVRIISREWTAWTRRRPRRGGRVQINAPHGLLGSNPASPRQAAPTKRLPEREGRRQVAENISRAAPLHRPL